MIGEEKLIKEYLQSIKPIPNNTKKLFTLALIGLPSSGKSYVAKILSEKLNLFVENNDKIRRFLNKKGFKGVTPIQKTLQKIAETRTSFLFENKTSTILDLDIIKFVDAIKEKMRKFKGDVFFIHITCSEKEIIRRIKERKNDKTNVSKAGLKEYYQRKKIHESLCLPDLFFSIDASRDVERQIDLCVNKLRSINVI